jgi:hypothetical protein
VVVTITRARLPTLAAVVAKVLVAEVQCSVLKQQALIWERMLPLPHPRRHQAEPEGSNIQQALLEVELRMEFKEKEGHFLMLWQKSDARHKKHKQ